MGTSKKGPGRPNTVPVGSRIAQKGNSPQKTKMNRSTARYVEVKIRITRDEFARGQPYFQKQKYLARFVLDAYREKVNRSEANDKTARLRILAGNMELLEPVLKEMYAKGKLNFLKDNSPGGEE
jgi:hypothetical protein